MQRVVHEKTGSIYFVLDGDPDLFVTLSPDNTQLHSFKIPAALFRLEFRKIGANYDTADDCGFVES